ncbi:glutaredoxin 2 [Lonsdalea populi]|uniref:glutaredoxin 2 n=1 Tax=Lonsdalea populi TaxID=1172565 RepID=UPI000A1F259C|nr:glutaredoxin 2 [Lonsdalea populi]OSN01492.1 glutaredoxin [Lonsdalea populi]QPQ22822.1 glutaredoxin 2 [Lonsdalea populi]RAT44703.1 glutaredoxin [Lonsdalea populi]RAT47192.1 glutaredoxin [Lonsdalea populi]RAT54829.1 glutaredoxin [Lonsdalea populi]
MKLYIYDHCPFCVKARMIFGLKDIPVELECLLNDDEKTPISMVGKKMLPILQKDDGSFMPESLDIVEYIDAYDGKPLLTGPNNPAIEAWIRKVSGYISRLLIPRFSRAPFEEFATPSARDYFIAKKEVMIGDFEDQFGHSTGLIKNISSDLKKLEPLIVQPNACNGELSLDDLHLFPILRSLTIVSGVSVPSKVADYRDNVAKQTQIPLLSGMAQ